MQTRLWFDCFPLFMGCCVTIWFWWNGFYQILMYSSSALKKYMVKGILQQHKRQAAADWLVESLASTAWNPWEKDHALIRSKPVDRVWELWSHLPPESIIRRLPLARSFSESPRGSWFVLVKSSLTGPWTRLQLFLP